MVRPASVILEAPSGASTSPEVVRQLKAELAQCDLEIKDEETTHKTNMRTLVGKRERIAKDLAKAEK